jgi:hypothetical protein
VKFAIRGAYSGLYEVSGPAERWGARMADLAQGWRPFSAASLQILGDDPVVRVNANRPFEAIPRFGGLAKPGKRHAEFRPGRSVPRFQSDSTAKLALGEFKPIRPHQKRTLTEPNLRDARAGLDGSHLHHFRKGLIRPWISLRFRCPFPCLELVR